MITPGKLAKRFGLSRTALLHYDSIGLLSPSGRDTNGYRYYGESEERRLEQICTLRAAGLPLKEIQRVLADPGNTLTGALEVQLEDLNGQIERLRNQQRFILGLLKTDEARGKIGVMSKALWISLLDAAGFSEADRGQWHADFEQQSPDRHQQFLEFLCIPDEEIQTIRARARARNR
jgi:DNA-binding transcriptional MerR regulator